MELLGIDFFSTKTGAVKSELISALFHGPFFVYLLEDLRSKRKCVESLVYFDIPSPSNSEFSDWREFFIRSIYYTEFGITSSQSENMIKSH